MRFPKICMILLLVSWGAAAQDFSTLPAPLQSKVELARQACVAFENGRFQLDWGAIAKVDLDGDSNTDWVLNESGFSCSSAASLYCGTGGCMSHFLIGSTLTSLQNRGWSVVTFGPRRVLLTDVHGSQCGGTNPTPCVLALAWDAEHMRWRSLLGLESARP